jgi:ferredoxin
VPRLRIEPVDVNVDVEDGETVLESLKRNGYSMFVGCRRGGCGVCLVEVLGGRFEMRPHAPWLVPDDRHTLACRAEVVEDSTIRMAEDNKFQASLMRNWIERALRAQATLGRGQAKMTAATVDRGALRG